MTTREKAEQLLKEMPEERVFEALEALEAVIWKGERPDTSVEAILTRHGETRLSPAEFERHFGDLPTDLEDEEISAEEEAAVQEARDELAAGAPTVPLEEIKRKYELQ